MHLFYQPEPVQHLTEEDSRHAVRTLRLKTGDSITVTDGHGNRHSAVITQADARRCQFRIRDTQTTVPRPFSIRICVAPTKNLDRIEWFIEKAVELGIERISFFYGQHSERRALKLERLEKIAVAAMKQSLQSFVPILDEALSFTDFLKTVSEDQRFIAHLSDQKPPVSLLKAAATGGRYAVLIGPEGDFSDAEIHQAVSVGFQLVTLGPNRLRTETAALTACQILNVIQWEY
ncbi:16S rRNA (uracil(1498)-N(3))-methyltransferase [Spirosoma taeanense]|uniref:Ribosomal RNA small subunit methyltransferase E n=1 Tax=Spirosoma taeanense TaxID=2735870 RepID=A0A6M5Y877_9BACT|nr:16S rRNA (uracil(1498)-N(3))-methyltransferase [Spirosoma taeanense]QJW89704.1 16S rRNA (uracil(1498)-N(3))-methyltransferase [Spirosoma taeanense]